MKRKETTTIESSNEPDALTITNVQVFPVREPLGKTRAFARLVVADQLQITGLRVIDGTNGLFVGYPNDPSYKGEDFRSIFYPVTRSMRDAVEKAVLGKYQEVVETVAV